jgi:hypothetical protein
MRQSLSRVGLRAVVVAIASLGLTSCWSSTEPCGETAIDVSVGPGLTPTVSWAPACLVGYVFFERIEGTSRTYLFGKFDPDNRIPPGRTYGEGEPANKALEPGLTYKITVATIIGGDAGDTIGTLTFIR